LPPWHHLRWTFSNKKVSSNLEKQVEHSVYSVPYILAYKSRNFGQILKSFFPIRLIGGPQNLQITNIGERGGGVGGGRRFGVLIQFLIKSLIDTWKYIWIYCYDNVFNQLMWLNWQGFSMFQFLSALSDPISGLINWLVELY
jgi:hypothetical protein